MTSAVRAPFRMNGLLKIAESQLGGTVHLFEGNLLSSGS